MCLAPYLEAAPPGITAVYRWASAPVSLHILPLTGCSRCPVRLYLSRVLSQVAACHKGVGAVQSARRGPVRAPLDLCTRTNVPFPKRIPAVKPLAAAGARWVAKSNGQGSKLGSVRLLWIWYLWDWSVLTYLLLPLKKNARGRGRECQTEVLDISVLDLQPLPLALLGLNGLHSSCFPPCF